MLDTKVRYDRLSADQMTMGLRLAGVGLTMVDYEADTVIPDELAADVFGLEPHKPVSREAFHARIHPADLPAVLEEVDKLIDPAFEDVIEVRHRTLDARGDTRWVHARKQLYRSVGEDGVEVRSGIAAILDITPRKKAEEATGLLIRELKHRTANVVAIVASMARMVMRSGPPEDFLSRFEPRIENLAENLRLEESAGTAELSATIDGALAAFRTGIAGQITALGPEVVLTPERCQTFAMLIHELATNSVKYGALSRVAGRVAVTWSVGAEGLELYWQESGGPRVRSPERRGFGTQVLERFAALTLGAQAAQHFEADGYRYELRMPMVGDT